MYKSVLAVSGIVASVIAAVFPNGTVDGLPISPHPRDSPQDHNDAPSGIETSDIYLAGAFVIDNTVYVPVIVISDEQSEKIDSSTIVRVTTYAESRLSNSTAVPTGGVGFTYSAIHGTGPRYANATTPAGICSKDGMAKVTPSANKLVVPSLGLDGSAISFSNGSYNLPGIPASTGSYGLPKPSELPGSYDLPKPPPFLSKSTPSTRNPFRQLKDQALSTTDRTGVNMLAATFLIITGSLITLL